MLAQRQVAAMQVQHGLADLRQVAGHRPQLVRADVGQAKIAQGLSQRVLQRGGSGAVEQLSQLAQYDAEALLDGGGQRAFVALDLVEVAGRNAQRLGQLRLREATLLAQPGQAKPEMTFGCGIIHKINRNRW